MSNQFSSLTADRSIETDDGDYYRPEIRNINIRDGTEDKRMEETTSSFGEMTLDPPQSGSGVSNLDTEGHGSFLTARGEGNHQTGSISDQQINCSGVQANVNQTGYSNVHQHTTGLQHFPYNNFQDHQQNQFNPYPSYNTSHYSYQFGDNSWMYGISMDQMSMPGVESLVHRLLPSQNVRSEIGEDGLQPYDGGSFPSIDSNVTLTPPNSGHFTTSHDQSSAQTPQTPMVFTSPLSRTTSTMASSPMTVSSQMIGYSQMLTQPTIRQQVRHQPASVLPSLSMPSQVPRQQVTQGHVPTIQGQISVPQVHAQEQQTHVNEDFLRDVDSDGDSLFHLLSSLDKITVEHLKMLGGKEKQKAHINLLNKLQQTPLFLAVKNRHQMAVKILLHFGADPNIQSMISRDRDSYVMGAPLHEAAMQGDECLPILTELLSNSKTNVNILSIGSQLTPLHTALLHYRDVHNQVPYRKTILELIHSGADITLPEIKSSKTVTMLVIESRDFELLREILNNIEAGQCRKLLQQTTRSGDTCLHVASGLSRVESHYKTALLRYLITKGADSNMANNAKELPKELSPQEWRNLRIPST
ncbi:hypothetical protein ACJMK2_025292 [Sinanodonta woodiana]|uniref:NF-kappa-B inhibitor zeta n=1 Tax=Sinanodonta woodiana TaxID=1069815 RepID=A0ABD3XJL8_SINWO